MGQRDPLLNSVWIFGFNCVTVKLKLFHYNVTPLPSATTLPHVMLLTDWKACLHITNPPHACGSICVHC